MPLFVRQELKTLALPPSLEPKCPQCRLDKTCKSPKLPVSGRGKKKILIVTYMPTEGDDKVGYRTPHPKVVHELRRNGIDWERDCWLDSATMCRPPSGKTPPKLMSVDHCRPHLIRTITELQPEVIILLGTAACIGVLGWLWKEDVGPIERWAGYQIPHRGVNAWVCPTWMPGEFPWFSDKPNQVIERQFVDHIAGAAKLKGKPYPFPKQPDTDFCENILDDAKAANVIRSVHESAARSGMPVAFDYETTTLKPHGPHAEIYVCSLACTEEVSGTDWAWCFPWRGKAVEAMKELFADPKVKKTGSNIKFEHQWTKWHTGIDVKGWQRDTMLASHGLENGSKSRRITSIKFQAFVHLGVDEWDSHMKEFLKSPGGNTPNRVKYADRQALMTYCGLDSLYELKVAREQTRTIEGDAR